MDFQLSEQQRDLISAVRGFATREFGPRAYTWESSGRFPREYLPLLAAQGLAGITISEADGGHGSSLMDAVLVIETVARVCPTAGDCVQAMNFGAIQQLALHGSDELKERFLGPCLRGDAMITIAMTEPDAGSAITDLRTRAAIEGDEVVLKGRKIFTSNADHADHFVLWVRFGDSPRDAGAVVLSRGTPGLEIDTTHRFMSGERYGMLYLDDARVPRSQILVPSDGFNRMLAVFNVERMGNAARSLALGEAALDLAIEHVKRRRQFGRALMEFQGLQWRIAEMKIRLEAARLLLYRAAANADRGLPSALETALAKVACNRAAFETANDALQLFGGHGYDNEASVNYIFRRTRGWLIAGGTVEQMLNRIASEVLEQRFSQRVPSGQRS